jgi:hypothetical protein
MYTVFPIYGSNTSMQEPTCNNNVLDFATSKKDEQIMVTTKQ